MKKAALILLILVSFLTACKTVKTTTTTEKTTSTIDTTIILPPEIIENVVPIKQLAKPTPVINSERVRVVLQHDTINNTILVESYVKPDTITIFETVTVEKIVTETIKTPAKINRWRWFIFGMVTLAGIAFVWKILTFQTRIN